MRVSTWLRMRRRMLATTFCAVVAAIAVGAVIGFAGASLLSDDGASTTDADDDEEVTVRIVSAILHPAGTARGRSRQRARLSVHARVTNGGARAVRFPPPRLETGTTLLAVDAHAGAAAGALLRPVPARSTADGVLRYEAAGAVTRRLTSGRRAVLRIAGRSIRLQLTLGSPARRAR
ncbi:MAG: hypothetical protein ACRDKY_04325 [Solirubrobacteraceae bacterium]